MLIIDDRRYNVSNLEIKDWHEHGLTFERDDVDTGRAGLSAGDGQHGSTSSRNRTVFSRRGARIDKIVLHWTSGERDERGLHQTLTNRHLAVHFFVRYDGAVFQFVDLKYATGHASPTRTTIGIEIQNSGRASRNRLNREVYTDRINNRQYEMLKFSDAQVTSIKRLCATLCQFYDIPYDVPRGADGNFLKERMSSSQIRNFSGIVGHYHVTTRSKIDPGTHLFYEITGGRPTAANVSESNERPQARVEKTQTRRDRREQQRNRDRERIRAMTRGRTGPNTNIKLPYLILHSNDEETNSLDPNAVNFINPSTIGATNVVRAPYQRYTEQINALRNASELDLAQSVPILFIRARDEKGDIHNLNEEVFSTSPFVNIFEPTTGFDNLPERPLASLVGLTIQVNSPSVGGPTGIMVGTLSLKIHNPYLVTKEHPKGKFISYMLRQNYTMRIRYGVSKGLNSNEELDTAFQWVEDDFFISQHDISINDDMSIDLKLTIMSAHQKLFNQVMIGENLSTDDITQEDANQAFRQHEASLAHLSASQINSVRAAVREVSRAYNLSSDEFSLRRRLHGAISNSQVVRDETLEPIVVSNSVEILKTIQSRLLTRRFENLLRDHAYLTRIKNVNVAAINVGPAITILVKPEMQNIIEVISRNNVTLGAITSLDAEREDNNSRNKLKIVFGNFNNKAGQWAGKPISAFPVNLEDIFAHIRSERYVGQFAGTMNAFIQRVNDLINEPTSYAVEGSENNRIEIPDIKYSFYPDPSSNSDWIFYLYDNKEKTTAFSRLLETLNDNEALTKEQIKQKCEELDIPWIEMGAKNSLIRSFKASTTGDDVIMSALMYQANNRMFNQRQADASQIPSGISREFIMSMQSDPRDTIFSTPLIMPLKVNINYWMTTAIFLFTHIYLFTPLKQYSGLYTVYELRHELQNGKVATNMEMVINITRQNRQPN